MSGRNGPPEPDRGVGACQVILWWKVYSGLSGPCTLRVGFGVMVVEVERGGVARSGWGEGSRSHPVVLSGGSSVYGGSLWKTSCQGLGIGRRRGVGFPWLWSRDGDGDGVYTGAGTGCVPGRGGKTGRASGWGVWIDSVCRGR